MSLSSEELHTAVSVVLKEIDVDPSVLRLLVDDLDTDR